jgi:hypothetical protein
MKITVTFDSIQELLSVTNITPEEVMQAVMHSGRGAVDVTTAPAATPKAVPFEEAVDHAALNASAMKTTEIINKAEAKEEAEEKKAAPAPAPEKVDESYRVQVRQVLAELNAQARRAGDGKKPAQEIIHGMGFDKLTDVPLDRLPELMAKAKEATDGAAQ